MLIFILLKGPVTLIVLDPMNTDFQAHLEGPVNTDFKAHLEGPENPQLYDPVNTDFRPVLKAQ